MKRTFVLLVSAFMSVFALATSNADSAQTYVGAERVYPPPPPRGPGWHQTPMYAPMFRRRDTTTILASRIISSDPADNSL